MTTSVAITTYNGRKYIEELLDSIRNQTVKVDEVIIVDDCSVDGTFEFVNEYISNYGLTGWKNYRNEKNKGWKLNFREALRKCSGDYIFLCDQDDIWMDFKIGEMIDVMNGNPQIQLLISNYKAVYDDGQVEKIKVKGLERDDKSVEQLPLKKSSLKVMRPGCTYCVRQDLVKQCLENDILTSGHDAMLWTHATVNRTIYLYNRITIIFRRHLGSASAPKEAPCVERRIDELNAELRREEFIYKFCSDKEQKDVAAMMRDQIEFVKKRITILQDGSLIKMILFQFRYWKQYPTFRNMLAEDYVLLLKR